MLRTTAGRPRRVFKVWPSGLSKGIACSDKIHYPRFPDFIILLIYVVIYKLYALLGDELLM